MQNQNLCNNSSLVPYGMEGLKRSPNFLSVRLVKLVNISKKYQ